MIDFAASPIFASAPVAYSVVDADGRQVAANKRFWELFGYPAGTELTVADLTHEEHLEQTVVYLDALTNDADELVMVEKRYVRADGSLFWGRLTARRIVDDSGTALLLGVIENIDAQRELQDELRDAAVVQSEFVARVSHELRNPLHTISGMAELLASAGIDREHRQQAEVILREASSLTSIVSDLLDIGRIDAGDFAVEAIPFTIRKAIDRSARAAQAAAAAKALRLKVRIGDSVPINVVGDPRRLGQILDNVIGNAIKFTAVGSVTLDVNVGDDGDVVFRVEDTGPGIPADFVDALYEPFQRANESTTGAGLGLAISLRLAESMGGTLKVAKSDAEGTTFALHLPLAAAGEEVSTRDPSLPEGGVRPERILVVEDNPETQMLASAQLKRLGYEHDIAGDGYEALERYEAMTYGAILMDWHLPGIDGLEATRRIRQIETRTGRDRTPIISVTARAMAADIEACRQAGADDFVAKPASLSDVSVALERWVGAKTEESTASLPSTSELFESLLDDLGDEATVHSLGTTFLAELAGRVEAIVSSQSNDDVQTELVAHTLASTSLMFGATDLGQAARDIEAAARSSQRVTTEQCLELQEIAARTEKDMRAVLATFERGAS